MLNRRIVVIAAAGLSIAGAVQAQSTVTLYGLVDLNLTHHGSGASGGGSVTALMDGTVNGMNGSRWGIRTVEDLGGGLRAGVVAEAGILADSGTSAQGGLAFGRQIYVSLGSNSAGDLRLGRQYALHDTYMAQSNPFSNGLWLHPGFGVTNAGRALPQFVDAPRINNVISYFTPKWGGFSGTVQYAPGESVNDSYYGVAGSYASGNVSVGLSHEWNKDRVTHGTTNKLTQLVGNYDFGAFKLLAGAQRARDLTTNAGNVGGISNLVVTGPVTFTADAIKAYTVGVAVPVGALTVGANYTRTSYQAAAGQKESLGRAAVGATYGLSKRTYLYTAAGIATGDLKEFIQQKRVYQVGLRHAF